MKTNYKNTMIGLAVATAMLVLATAATAQVHRCIDAGGKATYSDVACPTSAKSAEQVLGREATAPRYDPNAAQRTMDSIQRAGALQRATVEGVIRQSQGQPTGTYDAEPPPQQRSAQSDQSAGESCDTYSTRKGCIGGRRADNPNWSPRRGYYGNGGPADQKWEQEAAATAARAANPAPPTMLSNCNATGCWGNNGQRYNQAGNGDLIGPNGSRCRPAGGGRFQCN
ncbi:DUF4124 domain-containing protein [Variovorax humicola]|uniref:DUF4124 domain-containing protein n=1 Tax=Variovorax humicola TaxID=1769758 RepID=A0ABU8VUN5_9BURK